MREYSLPAIAPGAVQAYLDRPADSYDFLKSVPQEELAAHARELGYRYVTEPRISQLVCNIIAYQEPRFLFYKDMGGGKTKTILDIIRFRKSRGELQRALIAMPEFVHIDVWKEQLAEHAPDLKYVELSGDKEERLELIEKKADVYLIIYPGLPVFMSELKEGKKGKNKKVVDSDSAAAFASLFNFVTFEEVHRIRDHESLTFRLCCWLAAAAPFCYGLTGTPFRRNLMMLWTQFKMVDEGETFGSLGMYRAALFKAKRRQFGRKFAGYDFTFDETKAPALHRLMKHRSIVYDRKELKLELPHRTNLRVDVRMTKEQRMYYDRIKGKMKEAKGDYESLENIYIRFRQCASGFLSLRADDESRIEVDMQPNPKIEALKQVVLDMEGEKFIVFHRFYHSGNKIRRLLDSMKVPWATLYGRSRMRADGLDPDGQYKQFLEDKSCLGFVLQHEAGSEAINPHHVCDYLWFYERPDDPVISEQAENRVDRPGKTDPCFIGDLVVLGTVEEKLIDYVREGRELFGAVMKGEVPCEEL